MKRVGPVELAPERKPKPAEGRPGRAGPAEFAPEAGSGRTQGEESDPTDAPLGTIPDAVSPVPVSLNTSGWRVGAGTALLAALAALLGVGLGLDAATLLQRAFSISFVLGVLVTGLLAVAVGAAVALVRSELVGLGRLAKVEALRRRAAALASGTGSEAPDAYIDDLVRFYAARPEVSAGFKRLGQGLTDAHTAAEVIAVLDRSGFAGLDRQAFGCVLRGSRDAALVTALCPSALLDMAIMMWRNARLVREVAGQYGARPGFVGSVRLARRILANIALAGVSEGAHDLAVGALGGSLAAAVSARLGQGVLNGLLTARIGIATMDACRPLPFNDATRPNLGHVRKELLSLPNRVL